MNIPWEADLVVVEDVDLDQEWVPDLADSVGNSPVEVPA